jgi:hypothetical protein
MPSKLLEFSNDVRPNLLEKNIYKIESPYDLTDDVVTKSLNLLQNITGYDYRSNGVVDIVERLIDAENSKLVIIGGERLLVEFGRRAANNVLGKFIPSPTNFVSDLRNIIKGNFNKGDATITDVNKGSTFLGRLFQGLETSIGYKGDENFLDSQYGKNDVTETSDVNYKFSGDMIKEKIGQLNKKSVFSTHNTNLSSIQFQIQSSTFRNTYSEDFISNTNNSIYNDGNANRITETFTTTYFTTPYEKNEDELIKNYRSEKIDIENAQGFGSVSPPFITDSRVFNTDEFGLKKVKNDGGNSNILDAGENAETFRYSSSFKLQERINTQYGVKRGLVYFTSKLANENNIIAHDEKELYKENDSFGSEILYWKGNGECRTFTIYDQYDNYNRVIKFNGNNENNSVLRDRVLPRIAPTVDDVEKDKYNYFFTMENLALKDDVLDCEKGPNGGRWMWFPPYDVKLSDNNSVNWSDMNFLGRPEPIFSYQNTIRTLSLSFRLLIDTVKNIQDVKPAIDNYYKYIYACNADNSIYKTKTIKKENIIPIETKITSSTIEKKTSISNKSKYYFKNDGFVLNITTPVYSTGGEFASASTKNNTFLGEFNLSVNSLKELMVNKNVIEINLQFKGVATSLITQELSTEDAKKYNRALGMKRADNLMRNIIAKYNTIRGDAPEIEITNFKDNNKKLAASSEVGGQVIGVDIPLGSVIPNEVRSYSQVINGKKINLFLITTGADNSKPNPDNDPLAKKVNDDSRIKQRYAIIESIDFKIQTILTDTKVTTKKETVEEQVPLNRGTETPEPCDDNLKLEFQNLDKDNKFPTGFEKLNVFSPVFNSQTPFDFTKRYTFLHQLTRPSKLKNLTTIDNTVFGRMPVFVIRYGDFIYSKAIARSINFDITDSTWDLNPEGMGAIPLYCNVTMDLTLLGGQSLAGPIDRIQTANDSNFIANSTFNSGYYTGNKTFEKARDQEVIQHKDRASGKKPIPGSKPDSGNKPQDAPTFNLIKAENRGTPEPYKLQNLVATRSQIIEEDVVGPTGAILQRYIDKDKAIRDERELKENLKIENSKDRFYEQMGE